MIIEMKKTKLKMIKALYLGMLILDISKHLCINFGMITSKQSMEIEQNYAIQIQILHIKNEDFFEDISNDVEIWFDTSMMKMMKDRFR